MLHVLRRHFERYISAHAIHYYLASSGGGGPSGGGSSSITTWVQAHFAKVTIGGQTLYDLTQRTH